MDWISAIGVLAAFGAMFAWGFGDFFIQKTVRKIGDIESLAYIGVIGSIGLLPFVFKEIPFLFTKDNLILLAVLGLVVFIVSVINFEALKRGKLSVVEAISEIELPVTAILAFFFFRERLMPFQLVLVSIIFFGLILVATRSFSSKQKMKHIEKGVFLALLTALGTGVVNFLTATSSKQISPLMAVWVPWVIFTILCVIFIERKEGLVKFISNGKLHKRLILSMGLVDTLAWVLYAFSVLHTKLTITTAITESYAAVALFLGVWVNKEKIRIHQYIGAGMALSASVLLAFLL